MDELIYTKLKNGQWQVADHNGHTVQSFSKEDAKRLYYLYYKVNVSNYDTYMRNGVLSIDKLTLD